MDFKDGDDVDVVTSSDCENELQYIREFLLVNKFELIEEEGWLNNYTYQVFRHLEKREVYIEFIEHEINVILDSSTGDFVSASFNYFYSLFGVLVRHKIIGSDFKDPCFKNARNTSALKIRL